MFNRNFGTAYAPNGFQPIAMILLAIMTSPDSDLMQNVSVILTQKASCERWTRMLSQWTAGADSACHGVPSMK